ncbi:BPSS1780 family membrane protein [Marilutibacter penaei]|nr:BPSS1780 family membrane protein [Lysobacter penaei]
MSQINKVPASNGAQWLLDGFATLRKAPLALGMIGLAWGLVSALVAVSGQLWLNAILTVLGPVLFGGVVFAAREVEQGRNAHPLHLLQGLRDGKFVHFLALLLPQVVALIVLAVLLVVMVGGDQLQHMVDVMEKLQASPEPDPALVESLPLNALFAWLIAVLVVSVVAGFFTFVAVPEVMLGDRGGFAAMGLSFRACLRNLGAVLVFMLLFVVMLFAITLAVQILVALLQWMLGQAFAVFTGQLLLTAVLLPLLGGTLLSAWRYLLGAGAGLGVAPPPMPSTGIEA